MKALAALRAASLTCRTASTWLPSSPSNLLDKGNNISKELWTRGCPSTIAGRNITGRSGRTREILGIPGAAEVQSLFEERCPENNCLGLQPHQHKPRHDSPREWKG